MTGRGPRSRTSTGPPDRSVSRTEANDDAGSRAEALVRSPGETHAKPADALAVFLHPDNPLDSIGILLIAEIYGEEGETESWGQLGIEVPGCKDQEIILVSRQNNSGTYAYFRKAVLGGKRDYKLGTRDMHGSKDVVHLVEKTPCAIGYSGLAYRPIT